MKEGGRANALLVELMIVIFFFMIASMTLVELFASSKLKSMEAKALNDSMLETQNIADELYGSENAEKTLTALGFQNENNVWTLEYDGYTIRVTHREEETESGILDTYDVASYLKDKLGCGVMKVYYEKDARIKRVAVCGGAGKDFLEEAASVSDAYVSADLAHNTFIDAKTYGTALYDAGHYFTENPAVRKLTDILRAEFPDITFDFFDVGSPYFTI